MNKYEKKRHLKFLFRGINQQLVEPHLSVPPETRRGKPPIATPPRLKQPGGHSTILVSWSPGQRLARTTAKGGHTHLLLHRYCYAAAGLEVDPTQLFQVCGELERVNEKEESKRMGPTGCGPFQI